LSHTTNDTAFKVDERRNVSMTSSISTVTQVPELLVSGTRKFDRITPVLQNLHLLPVAKRIAYKVVMLVHKCLNGRAPSYLADVCIPVDTLPGRRQLRSAAAGQLLVPRTSTNIGRCGFHCCGPATWKALPVSLRTDNSSSHTFGKALKRHLFSI